MPRGGGGGGRERFPRDCLLISIPSVLTATRIIGDDVSVLRAAFLKVERKIEFPQHRAVLHPL